MKCNITIAERNRIVESQLHHIDAVIEENAALIRAARLDRDDVYQQLAVRLIYAASEFDPDRQELERHVLCQLRREMLQCTNIRVLTGITDAPDYLRGAVLSLDTHPSNFALSA